jgi:hypothetical protein
VLQVSGFSFINVESSIEALSYLFVGEENQNIQRLVNDFDIAIASQTQGHEVGVELIFSETLQEGDI